MDFAHRYESLSEDRTLALADYDIDFIVRRIVSRSPESYKGVYDLDTFRDRLTGKDQMFWDKLIEARTSNLDEEPIRDKDAIFAWTGNREVVYIKMLDGIQRDSSLTPTMKRLLGDTLRFKQFVNTPDVSEWYDIAGKWLDNEEGVPNENEKKLEDLLHLLVSNYQFSIEEEEKYEALGKHFSYYIQNYVPHNQFQTMINRAAAVSNLSDFTYENHLQLHSPLRIHRTYDEISRFFEVGEPDNDTLFAYRGLRNYILYGSPIIFEIFSVRKFVDLVLDYASTHVIDTDDVGSPQSVVSQKYKDLLKELWGTKIAVYSLASPKTLFLNLMDLPDYVLEGLPILPVATHILSLERTFLSRPFLVSHDNFVVEVGSDFERLLTWAPFVFIPHNIDVRLGSDLNVLTKTDKFAKSYRIRRFIFFQTIANYLQSKKRKGGDVKPRFWDQYKAYVSGRY